MRRYIITLLFLAMAVVLFFSQTLPSYKEIKLLKAEGQALEQVLADSRQIQKARNDLLNQFNTIPVEDIARFNKLLPPQIKSGVFTVMLDERLKASGLLLKRINIQEKSSFGEASAVIGVAAPLYKTISVDFTASGSYQSLLQFLSDAERSLRIIDVKNINFSSSKDAATPLEFTITAQTYTSLPVSEAPEAAKTENRGEEILAMLSKLKKIKLDTDFFKNEVFQSLVDFEPKLEIPQEYGRPNPFFPFEGSPSSTKNK